MPVWLAILLIGVAAFLLGEMVVALAWERRRIIDLSNRATRRWHRSWGLRLVAGLCYVLVVAQQYAYRGSRENPLIDWMTAILSVLAVALVFLTWRMAKH